MLADVNVLNALFFRDAFGHVRAHKWFSQTQRIFTTPATEWGALRVALARSQRPLGDIRAAMQSLLEHPKHQPLTDARMADPDWPAFRHLIGHKLVTDFWLLRTAEQADTSLVTLDADAWRVLPESWRASVLVLDP